MRSTILLPLFVCGIIAPVASSYAADGGTTVSINEIQSGKVSIIGRLGRPIGTVVEITGEWIAPEPPRDWIKFVHELQFRVLTIGDDALSEPLKFLERDVILHRSTIPKEVGQRLTVYAFESCRYWGVPTSAWGRGPAPAADRGFGLYSRLELVRRVEDTDGEKDGERIEWETYSDETKSAHLAAGKNVVVFVHPELHGESPYALSRISRSKLATLSPDREYAALLLKYDAWSDPRIRAVWRDVGHTKKPFLVVYSADRPPARLDPYSLKPLEVRYNK